MRNCLIISHNCMNSNTNMGLTMKAIFRSVEDINFFQLYFKDGSPDEQIAKEYFCIDDKLVLKNIIKRKNIGELKDINNRNVISDFTNTSSFKRNKNSLLMLRDIVWKIGCWKTEKLVKWVKSTEIDFIVYFSGPSCFSYDVTLFIAKLLNVPVITFFTDDYYLNKFDNSLLSLIQYKRVKKRVERIIKYSSNCIFVTENMEKDYKKVFSNLHSMTYLSVPTLSRSDYSDDIYDLVYLGNVSLDRWKSLLTIGKTLNEININTKNNYRLNIYSGCTDKKIIDAFKDCESIEFKGSVPSIDVIRIINSSRIALFVEDFSDLYMKRVKYSFSTKIADILASNTCLFAYGPSGIAPIDYLKDKQCACIVTNESKLYSSILDLLTNEVKRKKYIDVAHKVIDENHTIMKNNIILGNFFDETIINYKK